MRVCDVPGFVHAIEAAIVATVAREGIAARAGEDRRHVGVWAGERKIASIGLHVSRGVTTHGLALNVDNDLEPFSWAVPCGMPGVRMTSVAAETGRCGRFAAVQETLAYELCAALGRTGRDVGADALGAAGPAWGQAPGGMFWLRRNRFVGSYSALSADQPLVGLRLVGRRARAPAPSPVRKFT